MSGRTCDEIRALLPAHLDGDLDPDAAARVRGHLDTCTSCREHLGTLRLAVEALRRLPELPPPTSILAGVRSRLHPVPWHRRIFARRPWLVGVPVGALATALVVIGVALFQARFPRLPHVAEERTAVAPPITRDTREAVPRRQEVPQQQPETGRRGVPGAAPAPVAKKAPAPALVAAGKPTPPLPAPRTTPVATEAPPPRTALTEEAAPPPPRFVIPEPTPEREQPVTERRRSIVAVPAPAGSSVTSGFRATGAPPAGGVLEAPGTVALRGAPSPIAPGAGLLKAAAPRPAPEPSQAAPTPAPEILEALTVLLAEGEELDEIRLLVRRVGGHIVETRVLEPRARREAFAPHRARAGLRDEVSRGWKLTVRMPRRALAGFAEALERRPGRVILEKRTGSPAPSAVRGRPPEFQRLRITVLR